MTTPVRSLAALLVHLDTLRPGERAVIDVTASAGARAATYHVLADPDGLAVLRFSADTAASARLPQLFDAMTITMPGQLGRSAASLATMAAQLPLSISTTSPRASREYATSPATCTAVSVPGSPPTTWPPCPAD